MILEPSSGQHNLSNCFRFVELNRGFNFKVFVTGMSDPGTEGKYQRESFRYGRNQRIMYRRLRKMHDSRVFPFARKAKSSVPNRLSQISETSFKLLNPTPSNLAMGSSVLPKSTGVVYFGHLELFTLKPPPRHAAIPRSFLICKTT